MHILALLFWIAIVIKLMYEYGGLAWAMLRLYGVVALEPDAPACCWFCCCNCPLPVDPPVVDEVLSVDDEAVDEDEEPLCELVDPDETRCELFED